MALSDFHCVCLSSSLAAFRILFNFCHLNYDMSWCGSVRVHLLGDPLCFLYLNMFPSLGLGIFQNFFKSSSNTFSISISLNGNPLQYSCLENPMDGGAWCRLLPMGSHRVRHDLETEHTHVWCTPGAELDLGLSWGRITYLWRCSFIKTCSQEHWPSHYPL